MSIDYSMFAFPKGIISKKKKQNVSKNTYNTVAKLCKNQCVLCGCKLNIELHHIYYRSEDKSKIDDIENCILLCQKCHKKVHNNKKYWQPILIKMRKELST